MSASIRPGRESQRFYIQAAQYHLRNALLNAKCADTPGLKRKIKSALKSAGGAARHLEHRISRTRPDGSTRHYLKAS